MDPKPVKEKKEYTKDDSNSFHNSAKGSKNLENSSQNIGGQNQTGINFHLNEGQNLAGSRGGLSNKSNDGIKENENIFIYNEPTVEPYIHYIINEIEEDTDFLNPEK